MPMGETFDLFAPASAVDVSRPAKRLSLRRIDAAVSPHPLAEKVTKELWLALHLPHWPLQALHREHRAARASVVVEPAAQRQQIVTCNISALRAGISPGMELHAARVLSSELAVYARDTVIEKTMLEKLANWAGKFTPRVSVEPPDGVLLEIKASLRLFGGVQALIEKVQSELRIQSYIVQLAVAPTVQAALWFAQSPHSHSRTITATSMSELRTAVTALPVSQLRWPVDNVQLLHAMGVITVGDCLRLPREGFARRLGPELLADLDRALGHLPQVRRQFVARQRFKTQYDFEYENDTNPYYE